MLHCSLKRNGAGFFQTNTTRHTRTQKKTRLKCMFCKCGLLTICSNKSGRSSDYSFFFPSAYSQQRTFYFFLYFYSVRIRISRMSVTLKRERVSNLGWAWVKITLHIATLTPYKRALPRRTTHGACVSILFPYRGGVDRGSRHACFLTCKTKNYASPSSHVGII